MERKKENILLICNTSTPVTTFRVPLIRMLKDKGVSISVMAFDDESDVSASGIIIPKGSEGYEPNDGEYAVNTR